MDNPKKNFNGFGTNIDNHYSRFSISHKQFDTSDCVNRDKQFPGGVPLCYKGDTVWIDSSDTHTLVFGSTGSFKTRAVVMPTIRILGYAGESMIINDSKGELYAKLAYELKEIHGYKLITVNLRNPTLSNAWNPFKIPYEFYLKGDYDRASEFVNDIANNLMLAEISDKDPYWDFTACDLLLGLILLLFKYCKEYKYPVEAVNISNIIKLRQAIFDENSYDASSNPLWLYGKQDELIAASLSGSVAATGNTKTSILSVFDQKMRALSIQPNLIDMLSNDNMHLENIANEKTAIFLITPDEKTLYHRFVSLFIKQSYEYLIYIAQKNATTKLKNRINFICDEFSSLPTIADMPSMISAARSRNIRFLLVIQSKKQLIQRYKEEADTIISNCTNWIYFTSREVELLKELVTLCEAPSNTRSATVPPNNITVYDLQHLSKETHEALVLAGRQKPAIVNFLDIDEFNEPKELPLLPFKKFRRKRRIQLDFDDIISKMKHKTPKIDDEEDNDLDNKFAEYEKFLKENLGIDENDEEDDND